MNIGVTEIQAFWHFFPIPHSPPIDAYIYLYFLGITKQFDSYKVIAIYAEDNWTTKDEFFVVKGDTIQDKAKRMYIFYRQSVVMRLMLYENVECVKISQI